jgi:hypothetical protein
MRFKDLSPEDAQCVWDRWKYIAREILHEFNDDVFQGRGCVHENSYSERSYLLLETKAECLYIFPIQGNAWLLGLYRGRIKKELLSLKYIPTNLDQENLVGRVGLRVGDIELHRTGVEDLLREYLELLLRRLHQYYWVKEMV